MARKAGIISIDLVAGTAKFQADMAQASAKVREFGSHSVSGVQAASGAIRTLEGNVQNNVRAVERFLVTTLKLGPVLQAAFPIVGAIAFAGMIGKMGEEVYNFFKTIQQAPEKMAGAFRELNAPLRAANDQLEVTNARLENDIAKLEGHRQNTLKVALLEAREAADQLADSLDKDLASLNKVIEEQNVSVWRRLFGEAGTSDLKKEIGGEAGFGGFRGQIADITDQGNDKIRAATNRKAKDAAQLELNTRLQAAYAAELDKVNKLLSEAQELAKSHDVIVRGRGAEHAGEEYHVTAPGKDEAARIDLLKSVRKQLERERYSVALRAANSALTGRKEGDEASGAHKALEETNRLLDERNAKYAETFTGLAKIDQLEKNEIDHLLRQKDLAGQKAELVGADAQAVAEKYENERVAYITQMGPKIREMDEQLIESATHFKRLANEAEAAIGREFDKELHKATKELEEYGKALAKVAEEGNKFRTEQGAQSLNHDVRMIGIQGRSQDPMLVLQNQQALQRAYVEERYKKALADANNISDAALRIQTLSTLNAQHKLEIDQLDNQVIEQRGELQQKGVRDFFQEMQHGAQTAGNILYNEMHSALNRVSDQFANLVTGQKTNFGRMFLDIVHEGASASIKSGLQRGIGALGRVFGIDPGKGKPDGSSGNPLYVRLAGTGPVPGLPGGGSLDLGGVFGGGSKGGGIFSLLGKVFAGARAGGGPVSPGSAYLVGERGPELFSPGGSGYVSSNAASQRVMGGGSTHYYSIDARGTDPQLVEQRVYRAIQAAHDSAIATSVRATVMRGQRVPPGR